MIKYSGTEAAVYTGIVTERQHFGLLQAWMTSNDPLKHAQWLLNQFWRGKIVKENVYSEPTKILDIGCGTGELLFQAGNLWPNALLIGINKFAGQVVLREDDTVPTSISVSFDDYEHHPEVYSGVDADLAMITYTVGHFDSLPYVFSGVRAGMAKGGRLGIYDICRRSVLYPCTYGYRLYSKREIIRALQEAGFKNIVWEQPFSAMVTQALEEDARIEFEQKTLPFILTAEA